MKFLMKSLSTIDKKKKIMIKDEIFVVNQPKHTSLSVIVFDTGKTEFPLPTKIHENLYTLSEQTDLFFIFKGDLSGINLDKFSSLYEATGWILSGKSVSTSLFKVFEYSKEIFESYVSYTVWNSFSLADIKGNMKDLTGKIIKATMSDLKWPIFKYTRLTPKELFDIYKNEELENEEGVKNFLLSWYNKFWQDINKERRHGDQGNRYTTYKSESALMFFKTQTVNRLISDIWENNKEWVETFIWDDPRYLLTCSCKKLGINIQNEDLGNLSI